MLCGKKELAIPFATSIEVEVGRGKTVANGGQEDRCDGADVLHGGLRIDRSQAVEESRAAERPAGSHPQRLSTQSSRPNV